jgi:hypothetical protein
MASTLSKLKETASRVAEECKIKNPENLTLFKFLYQPKPESPVESAIASLERLTRLKREQVCH